MCAGRLFGRICGGGGGGAMRGDAGKRYRHAFWPRPALPAPAFKHCESCDALRRFVLSIVSLVACVP